jgi:signal transduction histidine kinase
VWSDLAAQRRLERSLALVRLGAVPFVASQVLIGWIANDFTIWPWLITAVMAAGAVLLYVLSRAEHDARDQRALAIAALAFDTAIFSAFALASSYEVTAPTRAGLILPVAEAALRFAVAGALIVTAATAPVLIASEYLRTTYTASSSFRWDAIVFQLALQAALGLLVGWLVAQLDRERRVAETRAVEAEALRDELGRRVDLLEAANRCARALASSLDLDQAFSAFIRELRGLIEFERTTLVLVEGDSAEVMATAGRGADSMFPPGTRREIAGSGLEAVLEGRLLHRADIDPPQYPEEQELLAAGLRARVLAPLQVGPRTIGMLGIVRAQPGSFTDEEIELASLLGRLVATAVQNIRSYEAERRTVEELRRLSALRADFVSLVSHELRSPMAAVIGAARTLEGRWRELTPEQRDSFLALIGDETTRLADLISDVLDTSRIDAGTFTFSFGDVDVGALVREVVSTAAVGQDEVRVTAEVSGTLPQLRGDRRRLRQVLQNLVENAIKYSDAGGVVRVRAATANGAMRVDVTDDGPGVPFGDERVIFEKFGRASGSRTRPGTGLGLFISRSIAEAHGGTLELDPLPSRGARFVLELPIDPRS